jgi:hypothetical protein
MPETHTQLRRRRRKIQRGIRLDNREGREEEKIRKAEIEIIISTCR